MNTFLTLMRREWLQHRFGWSLLVAVPFVLALLLLAFGQLQVEADAIGTVGPALPAMLAAISLIGSVGVTLTIAVLTSAFLVSGIARRDHADRSVEFWLSLPTGHASSLAAPLLMHLLVVPAAAIVVGFAAGLLISLAVVTRMVGFGDWFALPWGAVLPATLAIAARMLAGLPLALAWAAPLVLVVVLANAWLRRWGLPVVVIGTLIGGWALDRWAGPGFTANLIGALLREAGQALVAKGELGLSGSSAVDVMTGLANLPRAALADFGSALRATASPMFAGCVLVGAGLFVALVDWRRRGASAA
jgi:hypothetical protein